ncbi:hypothetical protein QR685DRAFT_443139, partial [Neurospora intermedia]
DAQFRTLNIFNLNDKEAPNNIEEINIIVKYYSKKGDSPSFAFRLLTAVNKEY